MRGETFDTRDWRDRSKTTGCRTVVVTSRSSGRAGRNRQTFTAATAASSRTEKPLPEATVTSSTIPIAVMRSRKTTVPSQPRRIASSGYSGGALCNGCGYERSTPDRAGAGRLTSAARGTTACHNRFSGIGRRSGRFFQGFDARCFRLRFHLRDRDQEESEQQSVRMAAQPDRRLAQRFLLGHPVGHGNSAAQPHQPRPIHLRLVTQAVGRGLDSRQDCNSSTRASSGLTDCGAVTTGISSIIGVADTENEL